MPKVTAYHRPATLDAALDLLADPGRVPLGGGTVVNTPGGEPVEVVDLQAIGLSGITEEDGQIRVGATTILQELVDSGVVPAIVRTTARRELPSTLRNQATIGGTIAARDPESVLTATLLVHGATVELADGAQRTTESLSVYLAGEDRRLITAIFFEAEGDAQLSATGRTPADTPIVAAIARQHRGTTTVAVTGVAPTPLLVDPEAPGAALEPFEDFRGSAAYRLHLVEVNVNRAVAGLEQ